MYEIVIGRSKKDQTKFGTKGTIFLGKHYVKMGRTTSLSNDVYMDVAGAHVVFICGKRGGGKSYTMGVIAEGMADLPLKIRNNLSFVLLDTMGIYWTMKYPNKQNKELLDKWGLDAKSLDVVIFTPKGYYNEFKEKGIPTDYPFSMKPSELDAKDWKSTFKLEDNDSVSILIDSVILRLKEKNENYSIEDIINEIQNDDNSTKESKDATINRFVNVKTWGLFDDKGTKLKDIVKAGQVTILDVSCYATMPGGWEIKSLVIGLVSQKLFINRMISRREEEFQDINRQMSYFYTDEAPEQLKDPLVWLVIDEAHEFLPRDGKTLSTDALVTIMREGRQPGISLILATQQPGKIHTDVMTQSDILISHRITAKIDTDALGALMQSYMRTGLDKYLNELPREKGAALVLDDQNERIFPIKVRPRFTWHGGDSPTAVKEDKKLFDF